MIFYERIDVNILDNHLTYILDLFDKQSIDFLNFNQHFFEVTYQNLIYCSDNGWKTPIESLFVDKAREQKWQAL